MPQTIEAVDNGVVIKTSRLPRTRSSVNEVDAPALRSNKPNRRSDQAKHPNVRPRPDPVPEGVEHPPEGKPARRQEEDPQMIRLQREGTLRCHSREDGVAVKRRSGRARRIRRLSPAGTNDQRFVLALGVRLASRRDP